MVSLMCHDMVMSLLPQSFNFLISCLSFLIFVSFFCYLMTLFMNGKIPVFMCKHVLIIFKFFLYQLIRAVKIHLNFLVVQRFLQIHHSHICNAQ